MKLDQDEIRGNNVNSVDDYFNEPAPSPITPLTIFFTVLAAILVAWFLKSAYDEWQIRRAINVFNQQMSAVNYQTQKSLEQMQLRNQQKIEANQRAKEEKLMALEMLNRRNEQERQAAINERRSKELAWENFYKPIRGCESSNDNKDLMKCANDYARAKKTFEAQWASNNAR